MGTSASVVIAYRDLGDPHRRRAFEHIVSFYEESVPAAGEVIVHPGDLTRPFSRAQAINAAVRAAKGDVIIQSDPDSFVNPHALALAVDLAAYEPGLVIPHDRYLYLSLQSTTTLITTGRLPSAEPECEFSGPEGSGNVVVFSRSTWEAAHGFDERFGMWGGDDAAFRYACDAFAGPMRRLPGDMWHLWHPRLPQSDPSHPQYKEQFAILAGYRDAAAAGHAAVRKLVLNR